LLYTVLEIRNEPRLPVGFPVESVELDVGSTERVGEVASQCRLAAAAAADHSYALEL